MAASFQERYDTAKPSYTRVNDKRFADLEAGTSILIPSPADIAAEIEALEANETIDLTELRRRLAARHGADGSCPVMTGMNLRIVAELSLEGLDAGVPTDAVVPIWKAVEPKSALAKKLPGGPARITALRARDTALRSQLDALGGND